MSKERIVNIKNMIDSMEFYGHLLHEDAQEFMWLVRQAERVQELENVNRVLKKANVGSERAKERLRKWVDELEIENERYREALKRMEEIGIQGMLAELEELEDEE